MTHPVVQRLRHGDPVVRRAACAEASSDPSAALLVDTVGELLADHDKHVRRAAADALAAVAATVPEVREVLRRALSSDDPARRWAAAWARSRIELPDPALLPAVVEAMGSRDADVRWAAARLLVDIERLHPQVGSVAIGLATAADDPRVRRMAVFCLRELAPAEPEAQRAVIDASSDRDRAVRHAAIATMAVLVEPCAEVFARLVDVLRALADAPMRRLAAVSLGELAARSRPDSRAACRAALEEAAARTTDLELRRVAVRALARCEAVASEDQRVE